MIYLAVQNGLQLFTDPHKALSSQRFFKTGEGQYGHGDVFIGVTVPEQRKVAQQFRNLEEGDLAQLLSSEIHEYRLTALLILSEQMSSALKTKDQKNIQRIVDFYVFHLGRVNNWDLVDTSAASILGEYCLLKNDFSIPFELASSQNLWEKRIAIVSTFAGIRKRRFEETLKISEILLDDTHDLIHKAVGWMLREMGKKDESVLKAFLDKHAHEMPRTMLRYSIEKFSPDERKQYMM